MTMPSQGADQPNLFDRFADWTDRKVVSKSWFFAFSVGMCVGWAPTYFVVGDVDTWQLLINTPTTVLTFLLVGLAANTGRRGNQAVQQKLNAMAAALAVVLDETESDNEADELREAVGLEDRESSRD